MFMHTTATCSTIQMYGAKCNVYLKYYYKVTLSTVQSDWLQGVSHNTD